MKLSCRFSLMMAGTKEPEALLLLIGTLGSRNLAAVKITPGFVIATEGGTRRGMSGTQ